MIGASSDQVPFAVRCCTPPLLLCFFIEPACVDMDITISNFTNLKAGGVLYCGLSCNGGSLGPLESDIPVMLLDSLLKRFASLKMSMKDYI